VGFECYRIGDLLLDAGTQEVTRDGTAVPVPRLSFKLLLSLARHAPNVVSSQQLEQEVWAGLVVDRGTVNKRVLLLRKALSEDKDEDPYITVVRGSGYRLVVPVERVGSSPLDATQEEKFLKNLFQWRSGKVRTGLFLLLGIVAILALYEGFRNTGLDDADTGRRVDSVTSGQLATKAYSQKSIAVLPFVDLSDGQAHQYLGDGIAEEVINLLTGMDGLSVAARTSSFAFRNTSSTVTEISHALKVGTLLEGSIRHSGDQMRVTAQLIDAQTGYHLWSKNYDRTFGEVFEVQDDIALNISQSLKLTMDEGSRPDSANGVTSDIEAFSLYLKGRELFNERIHLRDEGLREALVFFKQSAQQDPGFAKAHAGIALAYWLLTSYDDTLDKEAYFKLSEASANFALELDPDATYALGALASVHTQRGELEEAAVMFERIRAIGSKDSNIYHWEAMLHIRLGYFEELIGTLTEVYRLDPLNEHIGWSLAAALNFSGEPEKSAAILTELEDFTYRQYVLGLAAINQGNYPEARERLRDVRMRSGVLPAGYADSLVDALENPALAEEVALRFVSAVGNGDLDVSVAFESLLTLGSPHAFDLDIDLQNDIKKKQMHAQIWNNWAVALRRDPRFKEWVGALGYVDFWRKYGWPDRCKPTGSDDFECI
jgi:TolB-like protein/DNA-binding winged helix-turn-helix (wHTH) protein